MQFMKFPKNCKFDFKCEPSVEWEYTRTRLLKSFKSFLRNHNGHSASKACGYFGNVLLTNN